MSRATLWSYEAEALPRFLPWLDSGIGDASLQRRLAFFDFRDEPFG